MDHTDPLPWRRVPSFPHKAESWQEICTLFQRHRESDQRILIRAADGQNESIRNE